jgi:hypothetical protein
MSTLPRSRSFTQPPSQTDKATGSLLRATGLQGKRGGAFGLVEDHCEGASSVYRISPKPAIYGHSSLRMCRTPHQKAGARPILARWPHVKISATGLTADSLASRKTWSWCPWTRRRDRTGLKGPTFWPTSEGYHPNDVHANRLFSISGEFELRGNASTRLSDSAARGGIYISHHD